MDAFGSVQWADMAGLLAWSSLTNGARLELQRIDPLISFVASASTCKWPSLVLLFRLVLSCPVCSYSPARLIIYLTLYTEHLIQSRLIHQFINTAQLPAADNPEIQTSSAFNTLSLSLSPHSLSLIPPNPGPVSFSSKILNTLRLDIHPKKLFPHWPGPKR